MRAVLRQAAQQGMITAIVKDRYYRNDRIVRVRPAGARAGSAARFNLRGGFRVTLTRRAGSWRSRSWSISIGLAFTRRRGNDHILRDKALFQ